MTAFCTVAALLLAGALLFILPPLLRRDSAAGGERAVTVSVYRDQMAELHADLRAGQIGTEQFDTSRQELERRLLEEVSLAPETTGAPRPDTQARYAVVAVTALAVPACALMLYLTLGHPEAIVPGKAASASQQAAHAVTPEQIALMVERLQGRLQDHPGDADGWYMLARSYHAFGRFAESAQAYARAAALLPRDPQLLADYADTLAMANGRNLNGQPMELVQAALKLDARHQKALALAGTAAFNDRDYPAAVDYWQRLQATFPADSDNARAVAANVEEAKAAAAGKAVPIAQAAPRAATGGARGASVGGTVSLSPSLAAQAAPDDTLFIFARAVSGPRMPLAIVRAHVKDLPKAFTLDDAMAMAPAMKVSNFPEVMLGARISKSGNATPQSGDLMGSAGPVRVGSSGVKIVIDGVVP